MGNWNSCIVCVSVYVCAKVYKSVFGESAIPVTWTPIAADQLLLIHSSSAPAAWRVLNV